MRKIDKKKSRKLYRPNITRKNYSTVGRYSKFVKQCIDLNVWGIEKRHAHTKQTIIDNLAEDTYTHQLKTYMHYTLKFARGKYFGRGRNRRLIESLDDIFLLDEDDKPDFQNQWDEKGFLTFERTRKYCIETHLIAAEENDKSNLIYYVNDPNSEFNLICLDFDDVSDCDSIIDFISYVFPNCYHERSSSGTGLHYYIMVKYDPDKYWQNDNEGQRRNNLYSMLSSAILPHEQCFDAVKATCSEYFFDRLDKCGTLCKLPAPSTYEQFKSLYHCAVYDELYLYQVINYLNDLTCRYDEHPVYPLESTPIDIQCPPILIMGKDSSKPDSNRVQITSVTDKEKTEKAKNMKDSFVRELKYISNYVIEYYKQNKSKPESQRVYEDYITEYDYGKQDEDRRNRFYGSFDYFMETFDPELITSDSYQLGMYMDKVEWSDKQLTEWTNSNTSFTRKIYQTDIDIALGYIFVCGKNNMNGSRARAVKRLMKQEGMTYEQAAKDLENTAGIDGMMKFFTVIKVQNPEQKINGCGRKKAIALFKLLEHLELVECLDGNHYSGVCRKYKLR